MFGFEIIEIVGGLVALAALGLLVWKLSDSEEASNKARGRSDGKSKGKSGRK